MSSFYGNCYSGDYQASFAGISEVKYPKGPRLIAGFVILDDSLQAPRCNNQGEDLYAVVVCNKSSGDNPKSKPYKMRKAMLEADEYDAIQAAIAVPTWEDFKKPRKDGMRRIVGVRVDRREPDGKPISLVTHIKRPRDGVWECIEGKYEGPKAGSRFKWLKADGTAINPDENTELLKILTPAEREMWIWWNETKDSRLEKWKNPNGSLTGLTKEEFDALGKGGTDQIRYRIALYRAGHDPFCYD